MSARARGLAVLAIQVAVVVSIAVKYEWERHHCPMVWTRASQGDPEEPIRGRYIALALHANACGLPGDREAFARANRRFHGVGDEEWHVVPAVRNGQLAPIVVDETRTGPTQELYLGDGVPCEDAMLGGWSYFFIPEHAKSPDLLDGKYRDVWAQVTVPPSGPPRPVKLAIKDSRGFHVLNLD